MKPVNSDAPEGNFPTSPLKPLPLLVVVADDEDDGIIKSHAAVATPKQVPAPPQQQSSIPARSQVGQEGPTARVAW